MRQAAFGALLLCSGWPVIVAAAPAVEVRGSTRCPSAGEVKAALMGLVAASAPDGGSDLADLYDDTGSVTVRLARASGELIAERHLQAALSCSERAQTAAVIIAAWEVRPRAGAQAPLQLPDKSPSGIPSASSPPTPAPAPAFAPPPPIANPKVVAPSTNTVFRQRTADQEASTAFAIDAGILSSYGDSDWAPGVAVDGVYVRRDAGFSLAGGLLAIGTHAISVGAGTGTWRRLGARLDLRSHLFGDGVQWEVHAGLAFTAVSITGQSLPVVRGGTVFDPGGHGGLRVRFRVGAARPWVDATTAFWPRTHTLFISGTNDSVPIAHFEFLLGIGMTFGPVR